MSAEVLQAPELSDPPRATWETEYAAFLRLLPELLSTCPGDYVAVQNGQVVATGDDESMVLSEAYRRCGYVPLFVGRVTDKPEIVRIPSPGLGVWGTATFSFD